MITFYINLQKSAVIFIQHSSEEWLEPKYNEWKCVAWLKLAFTKISTDFVLCWTNQAHHVSGSLLSFRIVFM